MTIRVVPRNIAFRPFMGRRGFFYCFKLSEVKNKIIIKINKKEEVL